LLHGNSGLWRDAGPNVAGPPRQIPAFAAFLTGDGDKAEIADGGSIGARITIQDNDPLPSPRGSKRMSKPDDTGTDNGDVEYGTLTVSHCDLSFVTGQPLEGLAPQNDNR
jgi:hypothetical protein